MQFNFICVVSPPGWFGVPEDGRTVVRTDSGTCEGPWVFTPALMPVGYGTLSVYRDETEAIDFTVDADPVSMHMRDNYVTACVEADSPGGALAELREVLGRLLGHMTVTHRQRFSFKILV